MLYWESNICVPKSTIIQLSLLNELEEFLSTSYI